MEMSTHALDGVAEKAFALIDLKRQNIDKCAEFGNSLPPFKSINQQSPVAMINFAENESSQKIHILLVKQERSDAQATKCYVFHSDDRHQGAKVYLLFPDGLADRESIPMRKAVAYCRMLRWKVESKKKYCEALCKKGALCPDRGRQDKSVCVSSQDNGR